jgi:hypothetical protein
MSQVLADAIISGHFTESSLLLLPEELLQVLQGDQRMQKLLLSLVESLPLVRLGCLNWVGPKELERMQEQPIRWVPLAARRQAACLRPLAAAAAPAAVVPHVTRHTPCAGGLASPMLAVCGSTV